MVKGGHMYYTTYLCHHGVKGQKWGVRRERASNASPSKRRGLRSAKYNLRTYLGNTTGHYQRNNANTNLPRNDVMAEKMGWRKLSSKESAMHQYGQTDGVENSKWVSPDGHKEVVFTGKGKNQHITVDARDEGTYNYYDPQKNPLGHTVADVMPYIFLGNSADDPTTTVGRLYGSAAAFLNKPVSSDPVIKNKGQKAVYSILMEH